VDGLVEAGEYPSLFNQTLTHSSTQQARSSRLWVPPAPARPPY
jgi:hypothetical protein